VQFTVVYRRNNLAAGLALALFGVALYLLGWWGFIAFIAGTLTGAWQWVASISRANKRAACAQTPPTRKGRSRSVVSVH
jgi:hypothetical protein